MSRIVLLHYILIFFFMQKEGRFLFLFQEPRAMQMLVLNSVSVGCKMIKDHACSNVINAIYQTQARRYRSDVAMFHFNPFDSKLLIQFSN